MSGRTIIDKIWDDHVVKDLEGGWSLMHIDRHIIHDLSGPPALEKLEQAGLKVHNPALTFATADHAVSSLPGRTAQTFERGGKLFDILKALSAKNEVQFFDLGSNQQGIVHVIGPEAGISLPGATLICGDSHTCTHGGIGALAFGVGTSESAHALATQTLRMQKPKTLRINVDGALPKHVSAKDLVLHILRTFGAKFGVGHAIEFSGAAIRNLPVEARLTLCNLSVEMGARSGIIAPDETVFEWIEGREFAPKGAQFETAIESWRALASDEDAVFDDEMRIQADDVAPVVSWGTSPDQSAPITMTVPDPANQPEDQRADVASALDYMGLAPGAAIEGTPVDWVFIGSCANSRISDLREAARIVTGKRVAPSVKAWVVPGSEAVKAMAEKEGLDRIFLDAGFQWREPGCSMCVAANGEQVPPGARCVSTSNRNFVGRQGPRARTHLASPAMAAVAAIAGCLTDVRKFV